VFHFNSSKKQVNMEKFDEYIIKTGISSGGKAGREMA